MIPGEYKLRSENIKANAGRKAVKVVVTNTGDRPIQVGSHFHFFETNRALEFKREDAFGMRLNIPASTAVRFEPGEKKEVILCEIGGDRKIFGHNDLTSGSLDDKSTKQEALKKAKKLGFKGV